jgi:ribosomal protein S18 acetylase RimI-like enzyme
MSSFPPEGFEIRPVEPADAEACAALLTALERRLGYGGTVDAQELLACWVHADLATDSWLARRGGRTLAFGWLTVHEGIGELAAGVHPDALGLGIGSWLIDVAEARARELGLATVRNHVYEADEDATALLDDRGYGVARRFYLMTIELDGRPPRPRPREGLRIEPFRLEDARALHAALDEAFAEEWGFVHTSFEEWRRLRVDQADTSLYFLVRDGNEIAAAIRCTAERRAMGWVDALAVRAPWRRRGLGRALLEHAFAELHRRGQRTIGLEVDSENPTGALVLYESVGMTRQLTGVVYAKELA